MGLFSNQRGVTLLGAVVFLAILSLMGLILNSTIAHNASIVTYRVQYNDAFYVMQAGLEYALKRAGDGFSPVVENPGMTIGDGSFTINQDGSTLTATGLSGTRRSIQSIQIVNQADCSDLDIEDAAWKGGGGPNVIQHITVEKECRQLEQVIIDKMFMEWNNAQPEELVTQVKIEDHNNLFTPGQTSATLLELINELIGGNSHAVFNEIEFNADLRGRTFTITVVMADQSMLKKTFVPDD